MSGRFTAVDLNYNLARSGHDLPVICSPQPSLKGPVDSETCPMIYGCNSADAINKSS
jgi:hypothetical protein